ncbi:hypothetical protein A2U01_0086270, partial [Trifolium medium]|nr:hypothetical protein [Trifolium medium]
MKEYDVQTLEIVRREIQGWEKRVAVEIDSRGQEAKDSEKDEETLWHSQVFDLGNSVNRLRSTMELARKQDSTE